MRLHVNLDQEPTLHETADLSVLSVATAATFDELVMRLQQLGLGAASGREEHVWLDVDEIVRLHGPETVWALQFRAVVDQVRAHGWSDEQGEHVLAHVDVVTSAG